MSESVSKRSWYVRNRDAHNERQRQLYHKRRGREGAPPKRAYDHRKRRGLPKPLVLTIERRAVVVTFD